MKDKKRPGQNPLKLKKTNAFIMIAPVDNTASLLIKLVQLKSAS